MSILVVGSVAFDTLETPSGKRERVLGGAATHFALAASFFTKVRVVGVVGDDFLPEHEAVLTSRGIDTTGIEHVPGKSFHWTGSYVKDLDAAETLATDLNVFANFEPKIPASYRDTDYLFLANIDPVLQARVRAELPNAKLVAGDTMNYWISAHRDNLLKVLRELDILVINDNEARMLSGETNNIRAAKGVLALGPKSLVVKYAEHGSAAYFSPHSFAKPPRQTRRLRAQPLPRPRHPAGRGRRPHRRRRLLRRRLLRLHRLQGRRDGRQAHPRGLPQGHVLRLRARLALRRSLRHRPPAAHHPRRDRQRFEHLKEISHL